MKKNSPVVYVVLDPRYDEAYKVYVHLSPKYSFNV